MITSILLLVWALGILPGTGLIIYIMLRSAPAWKNSTLKEVQDNKSVWLSFGIFWPVILTFLICFEVWDRVIVKLINGKGPLDHYMEWVFKKAQEKQ